MPILVIFIVIALAFYVFYKIKYVRSGRPMEKKWISAKSSVALGLFVALFGLNQLFLYQTTLTYIVGSVFMILGALNIIGGYKSYKFHLPFAIKEAEELRKA
ncbi:hypothetical protein CVD28_15110 [Bacillus sp. M6-12]|uniref:YtpI family protein n=1 Tax=Bacillus sp. M6-12 TaxID=2054166 RepID=UPI000C788C10|nr:YtpI family protein [Bacillus sp. M6-12]PLS16978.1 hypothetical protein CVD28_15110 [Bacillus sp. M6-12]